MLPFPSQKAESEAKYGIRKLKTNIRNAVDTHFYAYICEQEEKNTHILVLSRCLALNNFAVEN